MPFDEESGTNSPAAFAARPGHPSRVANPHVTAIIYQLNYMSPLLSTKHLQLLRLLSLTVVDAHLLALGGIFYDVHSKRETHLRNARRALRRLYEDGYIGYRKYLVRETERPRNFYYLREKGQRLFLEKRATAYHQIKEATVDHDWLTALFCVHLFRCAVPKNIELEWHPPFYLDDKICDGAISLVAGGEIVRVILLETDRATHTHHRIENKLACYLPYLPGYCERILLFLVSSRQRKRNLQKIVRAVLQERQMVCCAKQVKFLCPLAVSPTADILRMRRHVVR